MSTACCRSPLAPRFLFRAGLLLSLLALRPTSARAAEFIFDDQVLTVPDGFTIELVARTPLVERPVSAIFDEAGHLYVTDSSGSNDAPQKQLELKPHRVVRLTDTKGTGKFDEVKVYADRMMFPAGAMWLDGSLYVGAPPSIWKLTDTNGDGTADQRSEWMLGKTLTPCANDLHGPYIGPDGWIYWAKGAFAEQTHERKGRPPLVSRAAHIFRSRPDGSELEPVLTGGMDNPVAVAFTPEGERVITATFLQEPREGQRDGLIHNVYGGVWGKVNHVTDDHPQTGDLLPALDHQGASAPCGLTRYTSDSFGKEYRDNLFSCSFNLHKVTRHVLVPEGASFRTINTDFVVSNNPDFHPTDVVEDADGSLIVLDTGGWYKLCCPTSQLAKPDRLGAIYRVRRTGAPRPTDPRGATIAWPTLSIPELLGKLSDPRLFVRRQAITWLTKQGAAAVAPLAAALDSRNSVEGKRNALWTLTRIDAPEARAVARAALTQTEPSVRHVALNSIALWRDGAAQEAVAASLRDRDPALRRIAAEALGRMEDKRAVPALLEAIAEAPANDRMLNHSLTFALIEIGDPAALQPGLASKNSAVRRAALIALDQMPGKNLPAETAIPLLTSADPVLRDTAAWLVSRHRDWGAALATYLRQRLQTELSKDEAATLQTQLHGSINDTSVQQLIGEASADPKLTPASRTIALGAMADSGLKSPPASWMDAISADLQAKDPALVETAIVTARRTTRAGDDNAIGRELHRIGGDTTQPAAIRLNALAALQERKALEPAAFQLALDHLALAQPLDVRTNAATVIADAALTPEQLSALASAIGPLGPLELNRILPSFPADMEPATGRQLLDGLATSRSIAGLKPEVCAALIAHVPAELKPRASEVFAQLALDVEKQKQHIDQLLAELKGGDIRRGQAVFNNPKFVCSTCHAMGYAGGHIGPDLTAVGKIRTERDLLEAVVYPSASFVRSFEPFTVTTQSGKSLSGLLRKDAPDEIVLAIGAEGEVRIPRSEIVEMAPGTISIMPQGLDTLMTKQELSDLLAFLKATSWDAK